MKKTDSKLTLQFNAKLSKLIPVISQRSVFKYKVRLYINYFMESLLLIATMLSLHFNFKFDINYIQYVFLGLRLCFYLLSFKLNVLDVAIMTKFIIIFSNFSKVHSEYIYIEAVLLAFHFGFAFLLALSCEQRRGNFDERLGVQIPYIKDMSVVVCAFFVHAVSGQFVNIYYPTLLFAIFHSFLCYKDNIYNFQVKQIIQGASLFGLTIIAIFACINLTTFDQNAIIMMGTISYFIVFAWFLNRSEFRNFKILQENPNSFAQWDYNQYFQKLIYLIKEKSEQLNEEILRGFYKSHHQRCFSSECPIRYCKEIEKQGKNQDMYYELELEIIVRYIESFLRGQLEIATIKYPNLKRLYIFYTSPSLEALRYCDKTNFIEFREAERIESMFQSKDIEFQRENSQMMLNELKQKIELYIDASNNMWRLLYDENVDLERLERMGIELLELKEAVFKYQEYPLVDVTSLKLIKDFRQYLLDEKVDKTIKYQQESTSKLYNFIEIHTKQEPILIISAEPQTLQRIQNVNASCCKLIGYSKKELLSRKLNDILPEFIGTFHTALLTQRSKQLLYESERKLQTLVYIVTRSGYIFESSLRILQLNSIKGRRWSCILTPTNETNILIITNGEGHIQGLTANAYPVGLDLNVIGKAMCPKIFDKLLKKTDDWRNIDDKFQHLFEKKEDAMKFRELIPKIKVKACVGLIPPSKIIIFEIQLESRKKVGNSHKFLKSEKSMRSKNEQDSYNSKHKWTFNFPNIYSNINYNKQIDIKEKKEDHYQFVNYGEGINQMRYLNGQIQYKEDKTESSFQKEETEGSLVEIIEFNMKKQIYTDLMSKTKSKYPRNLIEFSIWVSIAGILIVGAMVGNFLVFYLGAVNHAKYAYASSNFNILRFQYSSITHSAIELAYMSQGSFTPSYNETMSNITSKLSTISTLTPQISINESYINTYSFNTQLTSSNTFYDILSQFKLQSNNILNNPTSYYDFNTTSSVFKIMNLSVNYIDKGLEQITNNLLTKYETDVLGDFKLFIILGSGLVGAVFLICIRMWFIVNCMNNHKLKLMSIYLEIEQSTIKNILEKNNTFKAMLKYNLQLDRDEQQNNGQILGNNDNSQKQAKKRVRAIGKHKYFWLFFLVVFVCLGIFSINSQLEISYQNTISSNLEQIVYFGEANFVDFNTYSLLNYALVRGEQNFSNMTVSQYLQKQLMTIYKTQMKFRKMTLQAFNNKLFSAGYAQFFMDFWFKDGCKYFSNLRCRDDFSKVLIEGGDKYWIVFTLTMDSFISIVKQFSPLPPGLFVYFAPFLQDIRKALKYYGEDILKITYSKLISELQYQIDLVLIKKIWVFGSAMFVTVVGLIFYFAYFLKRMKIRANRLEEIIGLIPYTKLSTIIEFKKYIRKKFADEDV